MTFKLTGAPYFLGGGSILSRIGDPYARSLHNHLHGLEILLFKDGEAVYTIDGIPYKVERGSAIVYNCGVWHEETSRPHLPHHIHYFMAGGVQVEGLQENHLIGPGVTPVIPLYDRFHAMEMRLYEILDCRARGDEASNQTADFLLGALLLDLLKEIHGGASRRKASGERTAVSQIRRFIEENYREELSLDLLAERVYLNKYYVSHLFKEKTGVSPFRYLVDYRVEVAKRYLATTAASVESIAGLVGYESVTHFQNLFKRKTGVTPGEYRRKRIAPFDEQTFD